MSTMRNFFTLSGPDRKLVITTVLLLGSIRLGLWLLSFRRVQQLLDWTGRWGRRAERDDSQYRRRVAWAVYAVGRRMLGNRPCLPQALAAQWLLRRGGQDPTLRIGVTKDEAGDLQAHAWLEQDGTVIIGGRLSPVRYATLRRAEDVNV